MFLRKPLLLALCAVALLIFAADLHADPVAGTGGWEIAYPDPSLSNTITDFNLGSSNGVLGLSLSKHYGAGWSPLGDFPPTLQITFKKISGNADSLIVITNEDILNYTGSHWTGFEWRISSPSGSTAFFDTGLTSFDVTSFDPALTTVSASQILVSGGTGVDDGNHFTIDRGFANGIVIDVSGVPEGSTFTLWETPERAPEPATMTLLALGGIAVLRRRRNRK